VQALTDHNQEQNTIPRGPGGEPIAYGLTGEPITAREAVELSEDLDRCTLRWTPIRLPSGEPAVVRTVFRVFDEEARQGFVPEGHEPQLYASALYTADAEPREVKQLWTYGSFDEAKAAHPEATDEFQSGRVHVEL
jgi:hypothetical protein